MVAIQQWVLMLCTLSVLYCILESILPEKEPFPVIKLVCVLYILIAVISPAKNINISDFKLEIPQQEIQQSGEEQYQDIMLNQAEQNLQTQLKAYLNSQAVFPVELSVKLDISQQEQVVVNEVYIVVPKGTGISVVEKLITDYFSCKIPLVVKEKENE